MNTIISHRVAEDPHVDEDPQDSAAILSAHIVDGAWMILLRRLMVVGGRVLCGGWKGCDRESRVRSGRMKLRSTRAEIVMGGEKYGGEFKFVHKLTLRRHSLAFESSWVDTNSSPLTWASIKLILLKQ